MSKYITLVEGDLVCNIPKGMTNGEVIQALFPQSYFLNDFPFCGSSLEKVYFDDKKSNPSCIKTNEEWWNAPYQKGGEA